MGRLERLRMFDLRLRFSWFLLFWEFEICSICFLDWVKSLTTMIHRFPCSSFLELSLMVLNLFSSDFLCSIIRIRHVFGMFLLEKNSRSCWWISFLWTNSCKVPWRSDNFSIRVFVISIFDNKIWHMFKRSNVKSIMSVSWIFKR